MTDFLISKKRQLIGLIISYLFLAEVISRFAYVNLLGFNVQWKLFILSILLLVWFRPSNKLMGIFCITMLPLGKFFEVTGMIIYVYLAVIFIKLLNAKKRENY